MTGKRFAVPNAAQRASIERIAGNWRERVTWEQDGYIVLRGSTPSSQHYWIAKDGTATAGKPLPVEGTR